MMPKLQLMVIRRPTRLGHMEKHENRIVRKKVVDHRTIENDLN